MTVKEYRHWVLWRMQPAEKSETEKVAADAPAAKRAAANFMLMDLVWFGV